MILPTVFFLLDDYSVRKGLTSKPMFDYLDPIDTWPVTHHNGVTYHVHMKYFLLFDGQMIEMTSGLNGANCTMCSATKDQIHDPAFIKKGFKITNNITKINDLYYMLEKDDNGQIIRRKGGYNHICIVDTLFCQIFQLKGLKPKNKGHTNFYECCDFTKKVYLMYS